MADWGRVVALQANFCRVDLEDAPIDRPARLLCTRRSRLNHAGELVMVGDRVRLESLDWTAGRAAIAEVAERRNRLERPAVANVSRVLVVAALAEPALDPQQLSRFLIAAEGSGAQVEIVLSKADLVPPSQRDGVHALLQDWGYRVTLLSTITGLGVEGLRCGLMAEAGITVLCGPSGAGKSSLLNALAPSLDLRVAAVSGRLQRGRHTTRHVELFPLQAEGQGLVADTPGFNRPELPTQTHALAQAFPEIRSRLLGASCRFRNCRHIEDPGCAVGKDWHRFDLYCQCLAEVEALAARGPGSGSPGRRRPARAPDGPRISRPGRANSDPDHR